MTPCVIRCQRWMTHIITKLPAIEGNRTLFANTSLCNWRKGISTVLLRRDKNATIWAIGHILPIFSLVILTFQLFHCSAAVSRLKSIIIGLDNFLKWQRMVRMGIFMDFLPLKLCGKEGQPHRPNMRRGRWNLASNNLPRHFKVDSSLTLTWVYWIRIWHRFPVVQLGVRYQ